MASQRPGIRPSAATPFGPSPSRSQLSRRTVLKAAVAGLAAPSVAALLAACGGDSSSSASATGETIAAPDNPVKWPLSEKHPAIASGQQVKPGGTLRIFNYADYLAPAVLKAFEKKFDVDIRLSTFNDADEALTKVASGELAFDVYFPSYDSLGRLIQADLLVPLNHDYIPNVSNLWPEYLDPWYDRGWQYTVPYTVYSTGIGWRTDMIEEDVASRDNPYDVFWDPQYKGKLAIIDDFHTAMSMVLLRNGIQDVNTSSSDDIAMMREQLLELRDTTRPRVTISMYNDLPAGQYGLAQMWSGDAVNAQYYLPKGQSPDILRYWFPSNGEGMVDNDLMVVLAQGKNPVAAHFFINYLLDEKVSIRNFGWTGYQPPMQAVTPESMVASGIVPKNLATATVLQRYFKTAVPLLQLPAAADAEWHQVWQEFKAGG